MLCLLGLVCIAGCGVLAPTATALPAPTPQLPTPRPTITPRPTPTLAPASGLPSVREPDATATPQIYIVQSGDTLIPIANKFSVSVADLLAANAGLDAARLQIGQRILIPASGTAQKAAPSGALLPSPTPLPYNIRGLNVYRTAAGSLEALGEVFNPGPGALGNVQLQINLQDGGGRALDTRSFFVAQEVIQANSTSPFRVLFTDPPAAFEKYTVRALRGEAVDPATRFVAMKINKKEGAPTEGSQFKVTGEVANTDKVPAKSVRVVVTTYDKDKKVIGFRFVDAATTPLTPTAALPFTATLLSAGTVNEFAISVEGLK